MPLRTRVGMQRVSVHRWHSREHVSRLEIGCYDRQSLKNSRLASKSLWSPRMALNCVILLLPLTKFQNYRQAILYYSRPPPLFLQDRVSLYSPGCHFSFVCLYYLKQSLIYPILASNSIWSWGYRWAPLCLCHVVLRTEPRALYFLSKHCLSYSCNPDWRFEFCDCYYVTGMELCARGMRDSTFRSEVVTKCCNLSTGESSWVRRIPSSQAAWAT